MFMSALNYININKWVCAKRRSKKNKTSNLDVLLLMHSSVSK